MKEIIYQFSGTGNSLVASKKLGAALDIPIMHVADKKAARDLTSYKTIGFVFPVYAWGMPALLEDFIRSCTFSKKTYIFAVAICGGNTAGTLPDCAKLIKKQGGILSTGFAALDYTTPSKENDELVGIIKMVNKLSGPSLNRFENRFDEIVTKIKEKKPYRIERARPLGNLVGSLIHTQAGKMFSKLDKNFSMSSTCIQCGFCTKVCPAENITLKDKKLAWHGKCQQCYSCVAVCKDKGITVAGENVPEYKLHPQVDRNEMVLR